MKCPECGAESGVSETRETASGLRRRRKCEAGHRFTTYEVLGVDPTSMRDGRAIVVSTSKLEELKAAIDRLVPTMSIPDADPVLTD